MNEWEYSRINWNEVPRRADDIDVLNDAGKEGWELVTITTNNVAFLKRQIGEPARAPAPRRKAATARTPDAELSAQRSDLRKVGSLRPIETSPAPVSRLPFLGFAGAGVLPSLLRKGEADPGHKFTKSDWGVPHDRRRLSRQPGAQRRSHPREGSFYLPCPLTQNKTGGNPARSDSQYRRSAI